MLPISKTFKAVTGVAGVANSLASAGIYGFLFDDKLGYQSSIQKLRNETLFKIQEILDQVIIDNESKVV